MSDTININLNDNTQDGRFSRTNTATDVAKTATETKTEAATVAASTPNPQSTGKSVASALGKQALNATPLGAPVSQTSGLISAAANPVTLSIAAFALAQQAFNHWRRFEQERNQWRNTHAIQYGVTDRGNLRNQRTTIITGRIKGEQTGGRR